jgi:pimeloyl-ACP methyl ester carboxylesterase
LARVSPDERSSYWENVKRLEGLDRDSMTRGYQGLDAPEGRMGHAPLAILTAGEPTRERPERHQMQSELARMSSNSVHLVVEASGHNIHLDRPERVIRATLAVVEAARTGGRLTAAAVDADATP